MPSTPPLHRRLLFAAFAVALAVGLCEGVAQLLERTVLPYERQVPVPAPVTSGDFPKIRAAVELLRSEHPDWGERIPLAEDPDLGWALAPNADFRSGGVTIRSDERGLRASDLPSFQDDEIRLLSLGDSSVFGAGVESPDVFLSVTGSVLARAWDRPVAALNGGVPGHSSVQSLGLATELIPQAQPTWAVVANLWSDVYGKEHEFLLESQAYLPALRGRLRMLASYRVARRLLLPWLDSRRVGWMVTHNDLGGLDSGQPTRVPLSNYVENLRAMAGLTRQYGGEVVFLILPAPLDLDRAPVPPTVARFREAMRAVAQEQDAPLLDGPALFRSSGATIGFFSDNVHPTVDGHRLLGVGLADLLLQQGEPQEP